MLIITIFYKVVLFLYFILKVNNGSVFIVLIVKFIQRLMMEIEARVINLENEVEQLKRRIRKLQDGRQ